MPHTDPVPSSDSDDSESSATPDATPGDGIPHEPTSPVGGDYGAVPCAERPTSYSYLDSDNEPVRTSDRRPVDYDG